MRYIVRLSYDTWSECAEGLTIRQTIIQIGNLQNFILKRFVLKQGQPNIQKQFQKSPICHQEVKNPQVNPASSTFLVSQKGNRKQMERTWK